MNSRSNHSSHPDHPHRGFTLVEMLVVIGITALLAGLLIPAVAMARRSSRAAASQSNLKQWGAATINYSTVNKDRLPWEGNEGLGRSASAEMEANLLERAFWANSLPDFADEQPYDKLVATGWSGDDGIPLPGSRSIWIDPAADPESNAPWQYSTDMAFYFNYVPNCRLDDSIATATPANPIPDRSKVMTMHQISKAAETVLMLESRSRRSELSAVDPHRGAALDLCNADWHAFPNRHFEGGHLVFVDGHVAHALNDVATRSVQGSRDPAQAAGDWNTPKVIWNPAGVAGNVAP